MAAHADNYMIFLEILRLVNTSKRTSRSTHEIRLQRVSRMIPSLKADCLPSTVGRMSDSLCYVYSQHYTIRIMRKSREIATIMNDTSIASFTHHALRHADLRLPATAHDPGWSFH